MAEPRNAGGGAEDPRRIERLIRAIVAEHVDDTSMRPLVVDRVYDAWVDCRIGDKEPDHLIAWLRGVTRRQVASLHGRRVPAQPLEQDVEAPEPTAAAAPRVNSYVVPPHRLSAEHARVLTILGATHSFAETAERLDLGIERVQRIARDCARRLDR